MEARKPAPVVTQSMDRVQTSSRIEGATHNRARIDGGPGGVAIHRRPPGRAQSAGLDRTGTRGPMQGPSDGARLSGSCHGRRGPGSVGGTRQRTITPTLPGC